MKGIFVKIIAYGDNDYLESIQLRTKILREPLGLVYTEEQLAGEATQVHIAAFSEQRLVGILLMQPLDDVVVKMRQVAVDGTFQQQGVGRKLVAFSEQWAREQQFKTIELHAREVAVPFYEKCQYEKVGNFFYEVGIGHWKMKKEL
ncbi:MAG: GNAT family N-acetyltransferase [Chitinophagales bacterium]|nr:GNAT family N-acetyltransferase [Chitinophagales bacterium]